MILLKLFYFILLCAIFLSNGFSARYTLKDLNALSKAKEYQELIAHGNDIRPSKRNEQWKGLISNSAGQFLIKVENQKTINPNEIKTLEYLTIFKFIFRDSSRTELFDKILSREIQKCALIQSLNSENSKEQCLSSYFNIWSLSPKTKFYKTAEAILAILDESSYFTRSNYIGNLFELLKISTNSQECSAKLNLNALRSLYHSKKDNKDLELLLKQKISSPCYQRMKNLVYRDFFQSSLSNMGFYFKFLESRGLLENGHQDLYYTLFYLQSPHNSGNLNKSWNLISVLGKNFERRNRLLQILRLRDPLPGKILKLGNKKRRDILLGHFNFNFPEYFENYFKTCSNYYSGKGTFPNGNPTIECMKFIREKENFLPKKKKELISKLFLN